MTKQALCQMTCAAATAFGAVGSSSATPIVERAFLWIDVTDYNQTYTVGVQARVNGQGSQVQSVAASHQPITGGTFTPWVLDLTPQGFYWNWASQHVPVSFGHLTGDVTLTVQDANGGVGTTNELRFLPEAEIAIPMMSVSSTSTGYRVQTSNITGADFYTLWLWDPVERLYPSSQRVSDVASLNDVSFLGLVEGRTYRLFLSAYNPFTSGTLDQGDQSMFRSTTATSLTFSTRPVPELGTAALLLAGLGVVVQIGARRRARFGARSDAAWKESK